MAAELIANGPKKELEEEKVNKRNGHLEDDDNEALRVNKGGIFGMSSLAAS